MIDLDILFMRIILEITCVLVVINYLIRDERTEPPKVIKQTKEEPLKPAFKPTIPESYESLDLGDGYSYSLCCRFNGLALQIKTPSNSVLEITNDIKGVAWGNRDNPATLDTFRALYTLLDVGTKVKAYNKKQKEIQEWDQFVEEESIRAEALILTALKEDK